MNGTLDLARCEEVRRPRLHPLRGGYGRPVVRLLWIRSALRLRVEGLTGACACHA